MLGRSFTCLGVAFRCCDHTRSFLHVFGWDWVRNKASQSEPLILNRIYLFIYLLNDMRRKFIVLVEPRLHRTNFNLFYDEKEHISFFLKKCCLHEFDICHILCLILKYDNLSFSSMFYTQKWVILLLYQINYFSYRTTLILM